MLDWLNCLMAHEVPLVMLKEPMPRASTIPPPAAIAAAIAACRPAVENGYVTPSTMMMLFSFGVVVGPVNVHPLAPVQGKVMKFIGMGFNPLAEYATQ